MLFQLLHYWNQSKDPVKENNYIYTKDFMLKYYLRLGVLDPVFGCRVIPDNLKISLKAIVTARM